MHSGIAKLGGNIARTGDHVPIDSSGNTKLQGATGHPQTSVNLAPRGGPSDVSMRPRGASSIQSLKAPLPVSAKRLHGEIRLQAAQVQQLRSSLARLDRASANLPAGGVFACGRKEEFSTESKEVAQKIAVAEMRLAQARGRLMILADPSLAEAPILPSGRKQLEVMRQRERLLRDLISADQARIDEGVEGHLDLHELQEIQTDLASTRRDLGLLQQGLPVATLCAKVDENLAASNLLPQSNHAALLDGSSAMKRLKERAARKNPTTHLQKLSAHLSSRPKPMDEDRRRDAFENLVCEDVLALAQAGNMDLLRAADTMRAIVVEGTLAQGNLPEDRHLLLVVLADLMHGLRHTMEPIPRWSKALHPSTIHSTPDGRVVSAPLPRGAIFQDCAALIAEVAGEEFGTQFGTAVSYLNAEERKAFKLTVGADGRLYGADGKPFDTKTGGSVFTGGEGKAIFVMDHDGNLYASTRWPVGKFHHSSFMAGQPVACAGEIEVRDGTLVEIDRDSGHYKPSEQQLTNVTNHLRQIGVANDFIVNYEIPI